MFTMDHFNSFMIGKEFQIYDKTYTVGNVISQQDDSIVYNLIMHDNDQKYVLKAWVSDYLGGSQHLEESLITNEMGIPTTYFQVRQLAEDVESKSFIIASINEMWKEPEDIDYDVWNLEFMIMPHCGKPISKEHVKKFGINNLLNMVIEKVDYIHKKGYVHHDLKPDNILHDDAFGITIIDYDHVGKIGSSVVKKHNYEGKEAYGGLNFRGCTPLYSSPYSQIYMWHVMQMYGNLDHTGWINNPLDDWIGLYYTFYEFCDDNLLPWRKNDLYLNTDIVNELHDANSPFYSFCYRHGYKSDDYIFLIIAKSLYSDPTKMKCPKQLEDFYKTYIGDALTKDKIYHEFKDRLNRLK